MPPSHACSMTACVYRSITLAMARPRKNGTNSVHKSVFCALHQFLMGSYDTGDMADQERDSRKTYADEAVRQDLLRRTSSERTRHVTNCRERPSKWRPSSVRNPATGVPFRADEAWDFARAAIASGIPIEIIELELPPNKRGFVIKPVGSGGEVLYVKFEFGASGVFGRSFHASDYQPRAGKR